MVKNNPYSAYKQQSVMTMTPGDMLNTIYEGIIKSITRAKIAFEQKDYTQVNNSLQKAQQIIKYLQNTLDFKFPISNELNMLYDYFINTLVQANIKKDPSELDSLITMLSELKETYAQADRLSRSAIG